MTTSELHEKLKTHKLEVVIHTKKVNIEEDFILLIRATLKSCFSEPAKPEIL